MDRRGPVRTHPSRFTGELRYILSRDILSEGGSPPLIMLYKVHDMDYWHYPWKSIYCLRCLFVELLISFYFQFFLLFIIPFFISSYCSYHPISSHFTVHIIAFALHCIVHEMELFNFEWFGISCWLPFLISWSYWLIYLMGWHWFYGLFIPCWHSVIFWCTPFCCYGCGPIEGLAVYIL